ncbi:hypothetical protein BpHYR1_029799 [Brachionus plicatilis]|uniref:Uncharacterized protein n=1 Tax=Brachionus plicatilis TaxID=10195 RepID=A0A3M7T4Z3_BRAPC|nr:hypothetical protein BpHYR1_029799 [Brachionus plicatilis]
MSMISEFLILDLKFSIKFSTLWTPHSPKSLETNFFLNKLEYMKEKNLYIKSWGLLEVCDWTLKSKSDFDFEIILDSSQSQTLTLTFDDSDFKII